MACLFGSTGTALADVDITSAGPLRSVYLGELLDCQVDHAGSPDNDFFGFTPGACGTFLALAGTTDPEEVYGPDVPAGEPRIPYEPVSQSSIAGTGDPSDPFQVVTVVDLPETGLQIRQTDSYVVGEESYRTDIEVVNSTEEPIDAVLYHAADCQLAGFDESFGFLDPVGGGIYCSATANNSPAGWIEGFVPLSPDSQYVEDEYEAVWLSLDGSPLPNTCICDTEEDNGAGISWEITVPAGGSVTRSLLTAFSPIGEPPPPLGPGPPASVTLTPATATNVVETEHCVTAAVADASGDPTPNVSVRFTVSGAGSGSGSASTDASGNAEFCYTGPALPGSDTISAFADTDNSGAQNGTEPSGTATKTWVLPEGNCTRKITGGAWISTDGGWAHLNINVKTKKKKGLEAKIRYAARGLSLNAWDVDVMTCDSSGHVTLFGSAKVNGSGAEFRIDLVGDTARVRTDTGYDSGTQQVARGNIKVHKK